MSDLDRCPYCGTPLTGLECGNCKVEFVKQADELVERMFVEHGLLPRGFKPPERPERSERRCIGCDLPLSYDSVLTAAWERGDNRDAYITCADCGCQNFVES